MCAIADCGPHHSNVPRTPNITRIVARKHTRDPWRPSLKPEQQCQVERELNRTMEDECFSGRYYAASSKRFLRLVVVFFIQRAPGPQRIGRTARNSGDAK